MIQYDGSIDLATGHSATSKKWKNEPWQWSGVVERLTAEYKTNETLKEFLGASKTDQLKIKDVGGYVGGYLRGGRRKPENVLTRQLITLDIDFAYLEFWEDFCFQFNNAAVVHGTHKHSDETPRYRLVMPLSREVTPDEYVAITRKIAGDINIELFDNTTFETNRLMFWPSNPKDIEYYSESQDGPWLDADEVLDSYKDWKDSSAWPTADRKIQEVKNAAEKQEDPDSKKGVIGAFCRSYTITEALEMFLNEVYIPAAGGRYTYANGTAALGLVTYDDKFAYSHHGTDPCGGMLCNVFDLVRVHKFGHLDADENSKKSYKAMEDFCRGDEKVRSTIADETFAEAKYDFAEEFPEDEVEDVDWAKDLELDFKGKYVNSANNLNLIFANDQRLKGVFKQNDFDGKKYIFRSLPWRKIKGPEVIKNVDLSGIRNYIESVYSIASPTKIEDALTLMFEKDSFHPVRDYLNGLKWDGVSRLDSLLIDYFGTPDNLYTREAIRKTLVGAVARIFEPGIKFDLVLTIVGAQGTGKSTFIKKLGKAWFSDTFMTVQGKEALEQIQGAWLIEMAELAGLRKAEVEAVKHFISKQEDTFRPAYGRTSETYFRQCVFFGTTNNGDFLRDPTGNRRFLPVDVNRLLVKQDIFSDDLNVDQVWAEAVTKYRKKETLFLSPEAEIMAKIEQLIHSETDDRKGIIDEYLNTKITADWDDKEIDARRLYLSDPLAPRGHMFREYVCIPEIWCECLGKEKEDMGRNTRDINDIMRSFPDWEACNKPRRFKVYGPQRYYKRKILE